MPVKTFTELSCRRRWPMMLSTSPCKVDADLRAVTPELTVMSLADRMGESPVEPVAP